MTAPESANDGLKNGLLLTILLDVIAVCIGLGFYLASESLEGLRSSFPFILLGVWLVQFVYLPIAALVAALSGHGNVAKGLVLGLGISTVALPTLCFGGLASFGY